MRLERRGSMPVPTDKSVERSAISGTLNYFEEEEEAPKMAVFFLKVLLLSSLCEAEISEISQPVSVQTLKLRESAAIECNMKSAALKTVWYKLTAGRRLQPVATVDNQNNRSVVTDEFQNRFSVEFDGISNRLRISATSWDDIGTYFCGEMHWDKVQFGSGTFLFLEDDLTSQSVFTVDPNIAIFISSIILTICALGVYLGSLVWITEETNCCFGSCEGLPAPSTTPAEVQHEDHVQTNLSARQKNSIWTECVYVNAEKLN
ncbi:uncharacterized protein LOC103480156 isoform X2 [Poecilia reticulata]|nr:PREDICTED: uncharacterized protein LOC103480156 isoform X2 [Poecilia reticulata]